MAKHAITALDPAFLVMDLRSISVLHVKFNTLKMEIVV